MSMRVLFSTSECAPFAKTGGLADGVSGLAKAMAGFGHDVRVVMPLYGQIDRGIYGLEPMGGACVHMGDGEEQWVGVWKGVLDGMVPVWFIECERFFGREGIYDDGKDAYLDNAYRFALFSKACLQVCKDYGFVPDVIHSHDWPTALVPLFLRTWDRILSPLSGVASVLTIHNIGHQGVYSPDVLKYIGVGDEYFHASCLEDHGKVNLLKAGISMVDQLTTVSPTHADELLDPVGGFGLGEVLGGRRGDLRGILNGVDGEHWDPEVDVFLPENYSAYDLKGKVTCKRVLQERMGLEVREDVPLVGMVSRLVEQKGVRLIEQSLAYALEELDFQFVVLGSGEKQSEDYFHWLTKSFPGRVGSYMGFSNELSHLVEAGSDFFLMPSLYEPCGLNQIYSLRYGTIPLVRATGGLEDTVVGVDEGGENADGFKFHFPDGEGVREVLRAGVGTWWVNRDFIGQLRRNGMAKRFTWEASARGYEEVYRSAMKRVSGGKLTKNFMLDVVKGG